MIDHFILRTVVLSSALTVPALLLDLWLGGNVAAIAPAAIGGGL